VDINISPEKHPRIPSFRISTFWVPVFFKDHRVYKMEDYVRHRARLYFNPEE
jgi:hypothetical protein